jgi:hypothetical protein
LWTALAAIAIVPSDCRAAFPGTVYPTSFNGTQWPVQVNQMPSPQSAFLSGGPQGNSQGIPDGTYYYMLTDPSGKTLLSLDDIGCRQVLATGGVYLRSPQRLASSFLRGRLPYRR